MYISPLVPNTFRPNGETWAVVEGFPPPGYDARSLVIKRCDDPTAQLRGGSLSVNI